jgi:flavin-dependent dehydrogenase
MAERAASDGGPDPILGGAVTILGGAVAGCAAAVAARQQGAAVVVYEKSRFPRHKVCGEFLSHGVAEVFAELGLWDSFRALNPATMTRLELHFPTRTFRYSLPNPCFGLSRFVLDEWLRQQAVAAGADWRQEPAPPADAVGTRVVLAHGRKEAAPKGSRVFGFKAHHRGPATDAIELHFFDGCYVGVNPAGNGVVNVCGLGPEAVLARYGFDYDALCDRIPSLRARRQTLTRQAEWLSVGPLVYRNPPRAAMHEGVYPAGDALGFVDPFTGTGMFNALLSGMLAGRAAARGEDVGIYLRECGRLLHRPFLVSSLFRKALETGLAERGAGWMPGWLLFRLTRAHLG